MQQRATRASPLHAAGPGCWFRGVSGWEGQRWYAGRGRTANPGALTWERPAFWQQWRAEHDACREGVIVMDMSFMSKFRVQGRDAGAMLECLSANLVDGPAETITYTQWLNERGTIEARAAELGVASGAIVTLDAMHCQKNISRSPRKPMPA